MSSISGGGGGPVGPKGPGGPGQTDGKQVDKGADKGDAKQARSQGPVSTKVVDQFQRNTQLQAKVSTLSGTQLAQKLNFTDEDMAVLAKTFAQIISQHPNADRKRRAKMFAKAILKKRGKKGFSLLMDEDNPDYDENDRKTLEEMFQMIAEQLDSTPVFAQLVDDVTESVRKIR